MPCLSKIPFKIFEERLTFKGFSNIFPAYCDEQTKGLYKDNRRLTILKDFCSTRVLFQLNFTNHRTAGERGAQFKFLSTSSSSFTNISIFSRQLLQWTHLCKKLATLEPGTSGFRAQVANQYTTCHIFKD